MNKVLVVDDDDAIRRLIRLNLSDVYEVLIPRNRNTHWHWLSKINRTPFYWTSGCRDIRGFSYARPSPPSAPPS